LKENFDETRKILLSILAGHHNVRAIRIDTRLHSEKVSSSLEYLYKRYLIDVNPKDWKTGKSKLCFITDAGRKWLIDNSLNDTLQVLSKIVLQLRSTDTRQAFQRANTERYSRNTKIIRDHFIERMLKADKSPYEDPEGIDSTEFDQPFREALKKILASHIFLSFDTIQNVDEIEEFLEKDFVLFAPNMRFSLRWHPGAFPELEHELQKIENRFLYASEKAKERNKDEMRSKETHLMGLEWVEEKFYEEYLETNSKKNREKILAKIEEHVGWSVGKYLGKLSFGMEAEIAKYIDVQQRPFLMKFISSFVNSVVK
jgi:hypothetical protein